MTRKRNANKCCDIPESLASFTSNIESYLTDNFYRGLVESEDNAAVIFITDSMMQFLINSVAGVLTKWKSVDLPEKGLDILWMCIGLPLAPFSNFREGLQIIQIEAVKISSEIPNINFFMIYMRSTWIPLADCVNSFSCPERTDAQIETFCSLMLANMTQQQNKEKNNILFYVSTFLLHIIHFSGY